MTGADGMLGRAVVRECARRGLPTVPLDRGDLDVTEPTSVMDAIVDSRGDAVVHCAAYTNVEGAESERETAFAVNEGGAAHVARACAHTGALCVYVGTDYVFDGDTEGEYAPDAPPRPINVYGESKLAGEQAVRRDGRRWAIVRTSLLYGADGPNFVDRMLELARTRQRLEVVGDLRSRATWTGTLAPALLDLAVMGAEGTYHVADRGAVSRYELVREAVELAGLETVVSEVPSSRFPTAARRPRSSVLDTALTESRLGRNLPHWRESLAAHLRGSKGEPQ